MEQQINAEKLVRDYLRRFAKSYKVPRRYDQEQELLEWCDGIGIKYKDWTYYKGHVEDPHCALSIKDPKWCTLFELRWAHLIMGYIDIN